MFENGLYKGVPLWIPLFPFPGFFGVPSLEKYQRQETIFISTRKLTKGIEAPAVTILAFNNNTGYGWKSKTNATGFSDRRFTFSMVDHCTMCIL